MELELTEANWSAILSAISSVDKFVSLDLAACTKSTESTGGGLRSTGDFDATSNSFGYIKIVNLTLPNQATGIVTGGTYDNPAFKQFTALKTVSGAGVTSISESAFPSCTALTSVSFPAATAIGQSAFSGCTALTSVTLGATPPTLGLAIFYNITAAQTVTVRIPTGSKIAYGVPNLPETNFDNSSTTDSWGRAFKGGSGDIVNNNITLVFETYTQ